MKFAILSDMHGNFPALQAVVADIDRWQPDATIVNGDVVNGGPSSAECWQLVGARRQRDGWRVLRGNHEDYVVEWTQPDAPRSGPLFELSRLSHWTFGQMNGEVADLAALPDRWGWQAPDGSTLFVIHASVWGSRTGIYPWTAQAEMERRIVPYPTVFVTGHTHVPFVRQVGGTLLVNEGAVGLPGDGDRRASYGRITWTSSRGWQADVVRVAYDVAHTEADFTRSGFLQQAGPGALLTLVELRTALDAKTRWTAVYRERVLRGEIDMADAVNEFLSAPEFQPYLP